MNDEIRFGEYYLHENGSLICKPSGGVDGSSSFVKKVWAIRDISVSPNAYVAWLKEAFLLGANRSDIERCANSNKLSQFMPGWEVQIFGGSND